MTKEITSPKKPSHYNGQHFFDSGHTNPSKTCRLSLVHPTFVGKPSSFTIIFLLLHLTTHSSTFVLIILVPVPSLEFSGTGGALVLSPSDLYDVTHTPTPPPPDLDHMHSSLCSGHPCDYRLVKCIR